MTLLYIDPVFGISGDMTISAFLDAGCPLAVLTELLEQLPVPLPSLVPEKKKHGVVEGTCLNIGKSDVHLSIKQMEEMIRALKTEEQVREDALAILGIIVKAEAKVHGVEPEKVHFHELAHVDTLIDLLCAAKAISYFGIDEIYCGPIPQGRGFVRTSHGLLPNPPPVTVEILSGLPLVFFEQELELTTPTGAAIVKYYVKNPSARPPFSLRRSGVGFGTYQTDTPNVVRLFMGEAQRPEPHEEVWVIETDVDDAEMEYMGAVAERIKIAGALDVLYFPVYMKKGRVGLRLAVITSAACLEAVIDSVLAETTTFGLRLRRELRRTLQRKETLHETSFGTVRVKEGYDQKGDLIKTHIEFEDVKRIADDKGVPYRVILESLKKEL
ncbi:MAG TPA: nickel pincer cofactor biosynthesis protein LarC [Syntrophorhabdales bacterium]|nr:nickel pincer cofactor biosynthesis protein LarC [Syntrophorhabdales bacterium]